MEVEETYSALSLEYRFIEGVLLEVSEFPYEAHLSIESMIDAAKPKYRGMVIQFYKLYEAMFHAAYPAIKATPAAIPSAVPGLDSAAPKSSPPVQDVCCTQW